MNLFSQSSDIAVEPQPEPPKFPGKASKRKPQVEAPTEAEVTAIEADRDAIVPSLPEPLQKVDCALCTNAIVCEGNTYKCSAGVFGGQIRLNLNWGLTAGCNQFHDWQVPEPFLEATVLTPPSQKGDRTKGRVINTLTAPNGAEAVTIQWENGRTMTYTLQECQNYGYQVDMDGTEADIWSDIFSKGGDRHDG